VGKVGTLRGRDLKRPRVDIKKLAQILIKFVVQHLLIGWGGT